MSISEHEIDERRETDLNIESNIHISTTKEGNVI